MKFYFALAAVLLFCDGAYASLHCERYLKDGQTQVSAAESLYSKDHAHLLIDLDSWDRETTSAIESTSNDETLPSAYFPRNGRRERMHAAEAALKLRTAIFDALPTLARDLEHIPESDLGSILRHFSKLVGNQYGRTVFTAPIVSKQRQRLERDWETFIAEIKLDGYSLRSLESSSAAFNVGLQTLAREDGVEIDSSLKRSSGYGALAASVISENLGFMTSSHRALIALSLLHPLTDGALDQGHDVRSAMKKLGIFLAGGEFHPEDSFESQLKILLEILRSERPSDQFPTFFPTLLLLHETQLRSVELQRGDASKEDLLAVTLRKGGLTALAMAQVSLGNLTHAETKFFYQAGAFFQFGDDLVDLDLDVREGNATLWTRARIDQSEIKKLFSKMTALARFLEFQAQTVGVPAPDAQVNSLRLAYRFFATAVFMQTETSPAVKQVLEPYFPLKSEDVRAIAYAVFSGWEKAASGFPRLREFTETHAGIFDRHFLHDDFALSQNTGNDLVSGYRVSNYGFYFPLVRMAVWLQEMLRNAEPASTARARDFFHLAAFAAIIPASISQNHEVFAAGIGSMIAVEAVAKLGLKKNLSSTGLLLIHASMLAFTFAGIEGEVSRGILGPTALVLMANWLFSRSENVEVRMTACWAFFVSTIRLWEAAGGKPF